MSYRCSICEHKVPVGTARRIWPVKRVNGSIMHELQVCQRCHEQLRAGVPLEKVREEFGVHFTVPQFVPDCLLEPPAPSKPLAPRVVVKPPRAVRNGN